MTPCVVPLPTGADARLRNEGGIARGGARQRRHGAGRARHLERDERAAGRRARAAASRRSPSPRCATASSRGTSSSPASRTPMRRSTSSLPRRAPRASSGSRWAARCRSAWRRDHDVVAACSASRPWIPDRLRLHGLRGKRFDVIHGSWDRYLPGHPRRQPDKLTGAASSARAALGVDGHVHADPARSARLRRCGAVRHARHACRAGGPGSTA